MRKNIISLSIIILTTPFLFLSCITDNGMSDKDKEMHTEVLRKAIVGRWLFDGSSLRTSQLTNAYLEFLKNDTYVLAEATGKVTSGVYSVKNLDEIQLENYGSVRSIVINNSEALFTFVRQNTQTAISAQRAQELSESAKTQLLSREWKMLRVENGVDSLRANLDSSFVTFASSGTYRIHIFGYGKKSDSGVTYHWAWHPTLPDRIVYWTGQRARDDEKYFTIIRELDQSVLKTSESTGSGLVRSFTFQPAQ